MLYDLIASNRDAIVARTRVKMLARQSHRVTDEDLVRCVPLFLDDLTDKLNPPDEASWPRRQRVTPQGDDLLRRNFTIAQVVHEYGDIYQAITELAAEGKTRPAPREFAALNRGLDEAIANAVTVYAWRHDPGASQDGLARAGLFAHELRNLISNVLFSFDLLKRRDSDPGRKAGALLGRNLTRLRDLIDRSSEAVQLGPRSPRKYERVSIAQIVEGAEGTAAEEAVSRGLRLKVSPVDQGLMVFGDAEVLASALTNLLQNALKFTVPLGRISLRVIDAGQHVLIEVEDECGGLPAGRTEDLFNPFEQRSISRAGLGLGLWISRNAVESNGGTLRVHDRPGKGCVFTIDLPSVSA